MNIIDLHCDALYKIWESNGEASFQSATILDTNKERLQAGNVKVQFFAVFIPPELKSEEKFQAALDQIHYFYTEVLAKNKEMKQIKKWEEIASLKPNEMGAVLTLEGVDPIGNDLHKLSILYQLGVRLVGLTWNNANLAADGVMEPRGAGLTELGFDIVEFNDQHGIFTDVSHLSEKGFWDVLEKAKYPLASHSNSKTLCNHPRNLTDEQAKAMFERKGMINLVFNPPFVVEKGEATIADLIKHIDHFCSLGGEKQIGFGSDFDGISDYIIDLEDASKYQNLINELLKHYSEEQVKDFSSRNFLNHLSI